ncbi:ESX-1 secretion-associated protein EspI [Mycobacterium saskatchewanense]|uniref:CobQ/CobB/MinD/ParA nucleotide binding domain-containing protein n=1 Tax=Mycobacterium saskatchewanense TaxID=220927 RepID=A0AAJ3TWP1_9MYCO|nr:MinD/ParA family protein [Mycobacterium saskatchewanense]ORW74218.1 hypothetical protein AWC23_05390 [Mycobacterium saskatchewanense]BBX64154.1 ESX-1 secretion-associated protein EspI [Mycobacterium saskatchewanense]
MAADYDRLFEVPEGISLADEATAQADFDIDAPAEMPPVPTGPPRANGHVPPPMPVDWHQPPTPSPPRPPAPIDLPAQSRPAPTEQPTARPPMPADQTQPRPPEPAPTQHARHARREDQPPADRDQPGRGTGSKHGQRAGSQNGRETAKTGPPKPPLPQRNGRPVRAPAPAAAGNGAARRVAIPAAAPTHPGATAAATLVRVTGTRPVQKTAATALSRRGWRRWAHRLTGLNPGLSRDEKYELGLTDRIRRNPRGSHAIGVLGLKGGVGKTTMTVALGSVLAQIRRDRILALDADAGSGNLADRVGRQTPATIAHLLADDELTHCNDIRTYTSANAVNLEVLATEDYRTARRGLSEADWQSAADAVARFYNIVLADCGAGFFDPATRGVLSTLSGLVVVASASIDAVHQAEVAIDWLRNNGFQDLARRGCVVINHVVPGEPNVAIADVLRHFGRYVPPGRVVVLPWDKHIATGTQIELDRLSPVYRRRITELAAALSDDFDRGEGR